MISIHEQDYGLDIALFNEFTLEDFRNFEEAALDIAQRVHRPDLLLDLSMLKDFTIDMAVEQLKFLRGHENEFGRIAIVVDDVWIKLGAHISSLLTRQHPKYFDDVASAQAWLNARV
ncbi:MAG: STAS/SEC14 domain-containing protein [Neisseria sp.]|uniref:STAS/SEC14 domain-containing protein n=1 Tax=Neisseria sp. TaxID=192066 RepID=UPI0026DB9143|nr:STAS/SEC14 domain-containing protein [Neisseria sp.]MDO4640813.1 STAS/SEC14 domain-containing protein [Neisseria sp.]